MDLESEHYRVCTTRVGAPARCLNVVRSAGADHIVALSTKWTVLKTKKTQRKILETVEFTLLLFVVTISIQTLPVASKELFYATRIKVYPLIIEENAYGFFLFYRRSKVFTSKFGFKARKQAIV